MNDPSKAYDRHVYEQEEAAYEEQEAMNLLAEHRARMEDQNGYGVDHCECDPSVGLNDCLYCRTVACVYRYWDVNPAPEDETP